MASFFPSPPLPQNINQPGQNISRLLGQFSHPALLAQKPKCGWGRGESASLAISAQTGTRPPGVPRARLQQRGAGGGKRIALLKGSPEPVPSKSSFPGPLCCCGCASVACVCVCGPPLLPGAAGPEEAPPFSGLLGDARGHKGLSRREVPRAAGGRRKLPSNFLDNREGCALCALLQTHNRTPTKAPGSQQPSMPRMPLLSEGR